MGERRPDGALEADVLASLWAADRPMSPAEVNQALGAVYAYTTVMTVLTRLWNKGLVTRQARGRAFAYQPVMSESELATRRMAEMLASAPDRAEVLTGFVGSLSKRDVRHLRRLLGDTGP